MKKRLLSNSPRGYQDGFTLIEIMVVILILGLLATLVVTNVRGAIDRAKQSKAKSDLAEFKGALELYRGEHGSYPTTEQGLQALVSPPSANGDNSTGGNYIETLPQDPWGNPYFYQSDGSTYTLRSLGPSGQQGAGDAVDSSQIGSTQ